MNSQIRLSRFLVVALAALMPALMSVRATRADENLPVVALSDGSTPVAAPAGAPAAPIIPATPNPNSYRLYMSTAGAGSIGNLDYADEDVLSYKPSTGQWLKSFDGTNAGLPAAADIDAIAYTVINNVTSIYMSFDTPVAVPGLGTVDDSDVVVRRISLAGSIWAMVIDGSQVGLTTAAEDVDGIDLASPDEFLLSTTGNFSVPGHYGTTLTGTDEDLIRLVNGKLSRQLDGSAIGLAATNDVTSLAYEYGGEGDRYYLVTQRSANPSGTPFAAGDVFLHVEGAYAMDSDDLFWDRVTVSKIDAFDLRFEP